MQRPCRSSTSRHLPVESTSPTHPSCLRRWIRCVWPSNSLWAPRTSDAPPRFTHASGKRMHMLSACHARGFFFGGTRTHLDQRACRAVSRVQARGHHAATRVHPLIHHVNQFSAKHFGRWLTHSPATSHRPHPPHHHNRLIARLHAHLAICAICCMKLF
jgi:hypothetical protein